MPHELSRNPIHLGLGATAVSEPPFTGMKWYQDYQERHKSDGNEARLVSLYSFSTPWDSWEMHPVGSEVVVCLEGRMTLIQEIDQEQVETELLPGQYAINDPGVWHTADITVPTRALFITAGTDTRHRPR